MVKITRINYFAAKRELIKKYIKLNKNTIDDEDLAQKKAAFKKLDPDYFDEQLEIKSNVNNKINEGTLPVVQNFSKEKNNAEILAKIKTQINLNDFEINENEYEETMQLSKKILMQKEELQKTHNAFNFNLERANIEFNKIIDKLQKTENVALKLNKDLRTKPFKTKSSDFSDYDLDKKHEGIYNAIVKSSYRKWILIQAVLLFIVLISLITISRVLNA